MKRTIHLIFSAVLSLSAHQSFAKPPKETPEEAEKKKKALEMYKEAQNYYDTQEFDKALEIYKEIYHLVNSPTIMFNIGQCYRNLKKYDEAQQSFKTYLRDMPEKIPAGSPSREQIDSIIKEMQRLSDEQKAAEEKQRQEELEKQRAAAEAAAKAAEAAKANKAVVNATVMDELTLGEKMKKFALAETFLGLGVGLGAATLGLQLHVKSEGNITDPKLRTIGQALTIGADTMLVASGVTFFITRAKLKKERSALLLPSQDGVTLSLQGTF